MGATNRDYRHARRARWVKGYKAWLPTALKPELWAVIVGGVIVPIATMLATWIWWPEKAPSSLKEAAMPTVLVALIGAVTGLVCLFVFKAIGFRLSAPAELWIADQQTIGSLRDGTQALAGKIERLENSRPKANVPTMPAMVESTTSDIAYPVRQVAYLEVRNDGGPGDFWAELRIVGSAGWPPGQRFARWSNYKDRKRRLAEGEHGLLYLGHININEFQDGDRRGSWVFAEWAADETTGFHYDMGSFRFRDSGTHRINTATVTILSDPPMLGGSITRKIVFRGQNAEVGG